jgi:predicted enzyme related to lactoylglutathione lyase
MEKISANTNAINWFEIPAADIKRARQFYNTILDISLEVPFEMMGMQMSLFPASPGSGKIYGALVEGTMHTDDKTLAGRTCVLSTVFHTLNQ